MNLQKNLKSTSYNAKQKVFANNSWILYYNIINNKFEMDTVCRYNSSQTEVDNSIIEYVENLLKQYGIVL